MSVNNTAIKNYAHKTSFRLDIPDGGDTRSFQLNVQETSIPGMTVESVAVALNPLLKGTISGTGVAFDPLQVRMILDEDMNAYTDLMQWMLSTVNFDTRQSLPYKSLPQFLLIHIIDNAKKKIVCTFRYHQPFPVSIGPVDFSYIEEGNMSIQTDVQFQYKWFDIEVDGKIISGKPIAINPASSPTKSRTPSLHPSLR